MRLEGAVCLLKRLREVESDVWVVLWWWACFFTHVVRVVFVTEAFLFFLHYFIAISFASLTSHFYHSNRVINWNLLKTISTASHLLNLFHLFPCDYYLKTPIDSKVGQRYLKATLSYYPHHFYCFLKGYFASITSLVMPFAMTTFDRLISFWSMWTSRVYLRFL